MAKVISYRRTEIVLSYHDCLLRGADINLLHGPYWLNDTIIGFYFEYLGQQYKNDKLIFICPELTQLLKMTDISQYGMFLDPIDAKNHDFIFFPLNNSDGTDKIGGSHWSLLVCSRLEGMCYHFDSARDFNSSVASSFARNIASFFFEKNEKGFIEVNCPQQTNAYDCGLYVLCFADIISKHILKTSKISYCNYGPVTEMTRTKRSQLLDLITTLQNLMINESNN